MEESTRSDEDLLPDEQQLPSSGLINFENLSLGVEKLLQIQEGIVDGLNDQDNSPSMLYDIVPPILPEAGDSKASKYRCETILPPTELLEDEELFGLRSELRNKIQYDRLHSHSDCITYAVKHFRDYQVYETLKPLLRLDSRLTAMAETTNIRYPYPLQCHCWPQMDSSKWPLVCIGPSKSGKTICYVFYIMCANIDASRAVQPEEKTKKMSSLAMTNGHNYESCVDNSDEITKADNIQNERFERKHDSSNSSEDSDDDNFDYNKINDKYIAKTEEKNTGSVFEESTASDNGYSDLNHNQFMSRPKYFIICSTQQKVSHVLRIFEELKGAAKGATEPVAVAIPPSETIEYRTSSAFNGCDLLISTPSPLLRCLQKGCISFTRCKKFIIDDLDQTLQLHNLTMVSIMNQLITFSRTRNESMDLESESLFNYQIVLFAEKWTNLVKKFTDNVLVQPTIIFASMIEAAIYSNMRFEVENCATQSDKLNHLKNILDVNDKPGQRMAIVCSEEKEAFSLNDQLKSGGYYTAMVEESNIEATLNPLNKRYSTKATKRPVYILSDSALNQSIGHLNSLNYLIHYNLPVKSISELDDRFKLMIQCIGNKSPTTTCILMCSENARQAPYLYDVLSRSQNKSNSSKCELKSLKLKYPTALCWRYASLGVCRLEKLNRDDFNGTFCSFRHVIAARKNVEFSEKDIRTLDYLTTFNSSVQLRIIITHIISPSEFYFWPEAYRTDKDISGRWTILHTYDIKDMEAALYQLRNKPDFSISIDKLSCNKIYGFYLRGDKKVHRVRCLDINGDWCLATGLHQSNGLKKLPQSVREESLKILQVKVMHIDYGHRSHVYLKSLFELPKSLADVRPLAFRGFNLGIKPLDNEPDWPHKSTKRFYDTIVVPNIHSVTAWTRLIRENSFWFEHLQVKRYLENISTESKFNQFATNEPIQELVGAQLADTNKLNVPCLMPSSYLETISKWRSDKIRKLVRYAFLRTDKSVLSVYLSQFNSVDDLYIRLEDFNKQLIALEDIMEKDLIDGRLKPLKYFGPGTICLAKVDESVIPENVVQGDFFPANRCRIESKTTNAKDTNRDRYRLFCLDHGDYVEVNAENLFECEKSYITTLPFQAIKVGLDGALGGSINSNTSPSGDDLNNNVDSTNTQRANNEKLLDCVYSLTRTPENGLISLRCIKQSGYARSNDYKVRLYYHEGNGIYSPLLVAIEQATHIRIKPGWDRTKIDVSEMIEDSAVSKEVICVSIFIDLLEELILDIARDTLSILKAEQAAKNMESIQKSIKLNRLKALKTLIGNQTT